MIISIVVPSFNQNGFQNLFSFGCSIFLKKAWSFALPSYIIILNDPAFTDGMDG
jgi:hypothetical protein